MIWLLMLSSIPQLSGIGNYILLEVAQWNYTEISTVSLVFGGIYFFVLMFFINWLKKLPYGLMNILSATFLCVSQLINYTLLWARELPFWQMFIIQLFGNFFSSICTDLPMISLIGRFSEVLPSGLEATGITLLISLMNLSGIMQQTFSLTEVSHYQAKSGFFERIEMPLHINLAASILMLLLCPAFVIWN